VCGRYTNTLSRGDLQEHFRTNIAGEMGTRRYNVAPTEDILAIALGAQGERKAGVVKWGLIPWWSKDAKGAARMINARVESVTSKPAFRDLIGVARGRSGGRALILADGWYEWLRAEDPKHPRQPFRFIVDGGAPFAFAGLWTHARIDGERVATATILTCSAAAHPVAGPIHDRMPVALCDGALQDAWLSADLDAAGALALCGPVPAERLAVAPANPRMNKSGLDEEGADLLVAPAA
jgi:putative SOS response-associated peptidase YedK